MKNKKTEPDFTILMIGQRRTGKSSVLSAMLRSMEKLSELTGFEFSADENTEIFMRTKLSQLEMIFYAHEHDEVFSTLEGSKNNIDYGVMTDESISYRFYLGVKDKKKSKNKYLVEFVDIRGEDMLSDMEMEGKTIKDCIERASIIMIAIDSPALMEGKWKKGYGQFHEIVNCPDNIYECITVADKRMREKLNDGQTIPPKLILFVPLKCEKYYYKKEMSRLNEAVKTGYQNTFIYLEELKEYNIAITPILTLGDVVFDHYKTKVLPSGKEVVETFGDEMGDSMRYTPKYPLFAFRDVEKPKFSPQYCEQPLMYLLAYIMGVTGKIKEFEEKQEQTRDVKHMLLQAAKHVFGYVMFGVFYVAYAILSNVFKDKGFMEQVQNVVRLVKLSGEGYELVQDNLGLRAVVEKNQVDLQE